MTFQKTLTFSTDRREDLVDITSRVADAAGEAKCTTGTLSVYAQGATAGIMIQENWDRSVQNDVLALLTTLIPSGVWEHDRQDNNGDSHLKAGIVGPSETIPILKGQLGLSRWQNIFFCEFDGPRDHRTVVVTVQGE